MTSTLSSVERTTLGIEKSIQDLAEKIKSEEFNLMVLGEAKEWKVYLYQCISWG